MWSSTIITGIGLLFMTCYVVYDMLRGAMLFSGRFVGRLLSGSLFGSVPE